jgi:hypothetical protein
MLAATVSSPLPAHNGHVACRMHLQSGSTHEREELGGHTKPRARSVTSVRGFYEVPEQYSLAWVFRKEKSLFTLDCKFCEQLYVITTEL